MWGEAGVSVPAVTICFFGNNVWCADLILRAVRVGYLHCLLYQCAVYARYVLFYLQPVYRFEIVLTFN